MGFRILADLVVLLHFGFVLYAVLGGLIALRWPKAAWIHLPAVLWAAAIEFMGWICPLTPLENWLREQGGDNPYSVGFVEHYILPILYPAHLTSIHQIVLGILVLAINALVYWIVFKHWKQSRSHRETSSP